MTISLATTNDVLALQGRNVGLYLGVEDTAGVTLTGACDGSNKEFVIPAANLPVFPYRGVSLEATNDDILVQVVTSGVGATVTTTEYDATTGTITLTNAPALSTTSTPVIVKAYFVREFRPIIQQNVKVEVKQDSKTYEELEEEVKFTSFGAMEISMTQDELIGNLDTLIEVCFEDYDGTETPSVDVDVHQMVSEPKTMWAYVLYKRGDTVLGRMYLREIRATMKSLTDVKAGDNAQFALDITCAKVPLIVTPVET